MGIYNDVKKYGYLPVSPVLISLLGARPAIVLAKLIEQKNYAIKNNLYYHGILFDIEKASNDLGIPDLNEDLSLLAENNFIDICRVPIDNYYFIEILDKQVIDRMDMIYKNRPFHSWSDGLMASLNPTNKSIELSNTTRKIKHFFDNELKTASKISMVQYIYLEKIVIALENTYGVDLFYHYSDFESYLRQQIEQEIYNSKEWFNEFIYPLKKAFDGLC